MDLSRDTYLAIVHTVVKHVTEFHCEPQLACEQFDHGTILPCSQMSWVKKIILQQCLSWIFCVRVMAFVLAVSVYYTLTAIVSTIFP